MTSTPPAPGFVTELAPGLRRIIAPNPSPMTHWGTNTYLVGETEVAVIDPGPDDPGHLDAILSVGGSRITHILVTHAHRDHSMLAPRLAQETGAPVLAFGQPEAGRSPVMERLAREGLTGGGEGVDKVFCPDANLPGGHTVSGADWTLEAIHTPGHFAGHLCFALGDTVFTGDHVMGWASTLISPPDGDLSAFMASCERLRARGSRIFFPGHGAPIDDPIQRLDWLAGHRRARGAAILAELAAGPATPAEIAARIYTETPAPLLRAAARNVFAHLIDFTEQNLVGAEPDLAENARFHAL